MATTTTIEGNLTREPEIRYSTSGMATTTLGVAVNRRWKNQATDAWEEETSFFDVVCFKELAENVALTCTKGMRVLVTGRLSMRQWADDEGTKRTKVEIVAIDLGPSLRFATAEVARLSRSEDDSSSLRASEPF
jgi:single-strand DNA-binding protein